MQQLLFVVVQSSCSNERVVAKCGRKPRWSGVPAGAWHMICLASARRKRGAGTFWLSAFHEGCRCCSSPTSGPGPTHKLNQRIAGRAELAAFELLETAHSLRRTPQPLFALAVLVPGQPLNNGQ